MDVIDLKDIGKEGREEERSEESREERDREDTSSTENTRDNYDNTRSRINSGSTTQRETNEGLDKNDLQSIEEKIKSLQDKSLKMTRNAIGALESATGVRFDVSHGDKSKYLISKISDAKYSEKGNRLIALKFDGKDVILTKKGEINKTATVQNRKVWEAIAAANEEYEGTVDAVADEGAGFSLSDEARESIQDSVIEELESFIDDRYNEIIQSDSNKNIEREIKGIPYVDKNIDYDDLENPNQKVQYDAKIAGLKVDIEHWKDLEEKEQDSTKKLLYKTAKELCIAKKSLMEVRANQRPESEEVLSMIQEEAQRNDLINRFEKFKKWAKENITGVSAVAISVAGVITAAVIAGRDAAKKGAKAVGNLEKALANLAKKAGPAIAAILNFVAQAITWGAKALEFLSRNLWLVALFLTYLLYDTVKERVKK